MEFKDIELQCVDCGQSFTDTAEDQKWRADMGYENAPKRCKACRRIKKQAIQARGGDKTYGRPSSSNRRS